MTEPASFAPVCAESSTGTASGCPGWWPSRGHPQVFRTVDLPDVSVPLPHTPTTLRPSPCSLVASIRSHSPSSQGHALHTPCLGADLGPDVRCKDNRSFKDFSFNPCSRLPGLLYVTDNYVFTEGVTWHSACP